MSLHDELRLAWSNPTVHDWIVSIIENGIARHLRELQTTLVSSIDEGLSLKQVDIDIYRRIHDLLEAPETGFRQAFADDESGRVRRRVEQVLPLLEPLSPTTLLDIGCGSGALTVELGRSLGIEPENLFGVDAFDRLATETDSFVYLPFADGRITLDDESVDLATLFMVLHHEREPLGLLREVHRVLDPGGALFVRETDARSKDHLLFNRVMERFYFFAFQEFPGVPLPDNHQPDVAWLACFDEAGFECIERICPEPENLFTPMHYLLRKRE